MRNQLLTNGIDAVMKFCNDNRTPDTTRKYHEACDAIKKIYSEYSMEHYDEDLTEKTLLATKDRLNGCAPTAFPADRYLFRTLCMLRDYFNGRPFKDKYPLVSRYKHELEPFFEEWAEGFKASLSNKPLTIPVLYSIARDFFNYLQLQKMKDFNCISQDSIYAFLQYEYSDHKGCMGNVMYVTRLLCEYLLNRGYTNIPLELLPFALPPSRKKVLPSFNNSDMESILNKPKRDDAVGKRDYAILMLASVTGLRAIDIANLRLNDINWTELTIHLVQHKTGFGLALPLDAEAASAVADYIIHGRPDIELPYVFLTEVMPCRKLNDKSSVANILNKYTKLSGIDKSAHDGKSFHAFRRSMGSWLLNSNSEPEMISQILGHHSRDVLKRYLPLDVSSQRICAIGFEEIPVRSEVYR